MTDNGHRRRLDALAAVLRPQLAGCLWRGGSCWRYEVVGDGTDDPPIPPASATCEQCGRPLVRRVLVLVGVDAGRI